MTFLLLAQLRQRRRREGAAAGAQLAEHQPEWHVTIERTRRSSWTPRACAAGCHQIVQAPGFVAIVTESMHVARLIPLDRRPHVGSNVRSWTGDSRGWWEGKTLVVETTNFNDKRAFQGATRNLRMVERFTRLDNGTISYRLTVTDPSTYSRPWTLESSWWQTDEQMYESACHEGNIGLAAILAGARAEERK